LNYAKKALLLITISTALRLCFASLTELSADEVYYWSYALKLQWNYFDHPPIVAWLIRLTTVNLLYHNELVVRLGAIIASAICTWLIFKIGTLVKNQQTGWFAALLYTSSIFCSITAGANILPDSPQMVFWLYSILLLLKISRLTDNDSKSIRLWCVFGLVSGLCIMSKAHGVFLWIGVLLYVLSIDRSWLKYRGIYLSAMITAIIISPIIIWNLQNNFIGFRFQGGRFIALGSGIQIVGFIKELFGEIFINNPINTFLLVSSLYATFQGKLPGDKREIKLLLFCNLPLIAIILMISVFRRSYPHWSAPAYSCLLILPAVVLASAPKTSLKNIPRVIKAALIYVIFIAVLQVLVINHFPGTLSLQKHGLKTGALDYSLDAYGWRVAGAKFDSLYKSDIEQKLMPPGAPIIATNWDVAAAIEFYVADRTRQEVLGIGSLLDLHQYYLTNKYKKQLQAGDCAYFIVPSDLFYYRTSNEVNKRFRNSELALIIPEYRSGILCKLVYVYRMKGYNKEPPSLSGN